MAEVLLASPAKINLFLEIIGRRADGYHDIETIMQLVDLCDEVEMRRRPQGIHLQVSGADLPEGRGNLAYRAAALALEAAGLTDGVEIHLVKRIPVAGGLGGGSSNAAAVLLGVKRLYGLDWSLERLRQLASQLGSDVAFFLGDSLAVARGRGELLSALTPWPPHWIVLANPGIAISTAWAYQEASSKLTGWQGRVTLPTLTAGGPLGWPPVWAFNRFEEVVLTRRPELSTLKTLLQEGGGAPVVMSGSGASFFAVVPDAPAARALAARVRTSGAFAAAVTTLPTNPMLEALT